MEIQQQYLCIEANTQIFLFDITQQQQHIDALLNLTVINYIKYEN